MIYYRDEKHGHSILKHTQGNISSECHSEQFRIDYSRSDILGTPNVLSMSQKAQNYKLFDELMKNNVDLSEVLKNAKKSDDLQRQLDSAKKTEVDAELFAIMESAVKGEPSVKSARQRASDVKSKIITELCIKNPEYAEALHEYRRAVNEAYIKLKEGTSPDRSE